MMTVTRVQGLPMVRSVPKASALADGDSESDEQQPTVIASNARQVNTETTVTTLVLSSTDSRLPSLSLEDVLERSGVNNSADVLLVTDNQSQTGGIEVDQVIGATGLAVADREQIQDAIDAIESSDAVVVEVETTNNEQTVTVRAADIDTVYTQAGVQIGGELASNLSNFLLLKNGWAYTDMQSSPLDLPVEPTGQLPGDGWALWRTATDGFHEIQDVISGAWNRVVGQVVDTSPKTAADVSGVFTSISTDVQIIYTSSSTTTLQLSSDGIFTNTRSSLITSETGFLDVSYTLHTFGSPSGQKTSFSGAAQSDGSTSASVHSSEDSSVVAGDMFGSYQILEDGITLELQFADGSVEQQLFLKTTRGSVTVDGQSFSRYGDASDNMLQNLLSMLMDSGASELRAKWLKGLADAVKRSAKVAPQSGSNGENNQVVTQKHRSHQ